MLWSESVLGTILAALLGPLGIALAVLAMAGAGVVCMASGGRVRAGDDGPKEPAGQENEQ